MAHEDMFDTEMRFTNNVQTVSPKQVEIFMDASRQGVFHGNDAPISRSSLDGAEDIGERLCGDCRCRLPVHATSCGITVRAVDSLEGYLHRVPLNVD